MKNTDIDKLMNMFDQNMSLDYIQMGVPEEYRKITHSDENDNNGNIILKILEKFGF